MIRAALRRTLGQENRIFRWLDLSTRTRERRFARIASLEILNLCVSQRLANPDLCGRPLYERVASKYLDITDVEARDVVERARQSFAIWPCERDLKLSDVARYIIVNEYIESHGISGVGTHFKETVRKIIADTL